MIHQIRYLEKKFGIINEYGQKLNEIINSDGARGFNKLTGATKGNIIGVSMATKIALSQANATVYEAVLKELIKKLTWQTNLEIQRQRVLLKQFIFDITNQIEWELEIFEGRRKLSKAEIEYEKNKAELRGVELLKLKAEAQLQIMELKKQIVLIEKEALPFLAEALNAEMQAVDARKRVLEVLIQIAKNELQLLEAERQKTLKEVDLNHAEIQLIEKQLTLLPKYNEKLMASQQLVVAIKAHLNALKTYGIAAEEAEYKARESEYAYLQRDKEIDIEERLIRNEVNEAEDATQIIREEQRIEIARHKSGLSGQAADLREQIFVKRMNLEYDKRFKEREISLKSFISNQNTRKNATNQSTKGKLDAVKDSAVAQSNALVKAVVRYHKSRRYNYLQHIIHKKGTPPRPGGLGTPPPPDLNFNVTHSSGAGDSD